MVHFIYLWYDRSRKMFYVGQHSGELDDGYLSSSKWLSGEIRYRTLDFKRRILKICSSKNEAQILEGQLLQKIREHEFGTKYYNGKQGKPKGHSPWNKGRFKPKTPKPKSIRTNPASAANARKGADKLRLKATGRKRSYRPDGSWTWEYKTPVLGNKEPAEPRTT